eukprot:7406066-Pyramimonas_sp.AAC.2
MKPSSIKNKLEVMDGALSNDEEDNLIKPRTEENGYAKLHEDLWYLLNDTVEGTEPRGTLKAYGST